MSIHDSAPESMAARRSRLRRSIRIVLIIGLALLVVAASVSAAITARAARGLVADLRALQGLDTAALASLDPAKLGELRDRFARMEANLATLRRTTQPLLALAPSLGWLPRVGEEVAAAPALLDLADSVAGAGRAAMDGALPVLAAFQGTGQGSATERMLPALVATAPHWQDAEAALQRAAAARRQIDPATLDRRLAGQLQRLDGYLPALQAGVGLAKIAPALLGADRPRTYLVLAQNSDELRPTGGFISGVGLVTLDQGKIGQLDFQDSYAIYNPNVDHPRAPMDLERYMLAQMLLVRDANWSPDFPTTAAVAQSLFLLDTGQPTDGVIAFDVEATKRIVAALEPLALSGYAEPLTSSNLVTALRTVWAAPAEAEGTVRESKTSDWWLHRKDFMGDLAAAARAKLESGQVDFGKLAWALKSALDEKHLLIALNDPTSMATLAQAAWDGALHPGDDDYLFVTDTNVGWNKVNPLLTRLTAYRVTPRPDGTAQAQLTLTYRHAGQPLDEPCRHEARYGDTYEDMARRCYFNYVRVYVPGGATLVAAEGFEPDTVATLPGERGTTVLAGYLVVPAGQERQVSFTYDLPPHTVGPQTYRLALQKQAGTPPWSVEVFLAGAWRPVQPDGQATAEGVSFAFDLAADTQVVAEAAR